MHLTNIGTTLSLFGSTSICLSHYRLQAAEKAHWVSSVPIAIAISVVGIIGNQLSLLVWGRIRLVARVRFLKISFSWYSDLRRHENRF